MRQLRALVALRWQMIRDRRVRRGLLLLALVLPLLVIAGGAAGQVARDADLSFNILLLTPSLYLGFAVLTVLAPLSNGGGAELFPDDQLLAYPIRPGTVFLGSLASAPLNLAWATQVVALATATSFVSDRTALSVLGQLTALAYIALTTTAGQALGWFVAGLRQRRAGRAVARGIGGAGFVGLIATVLSGHGVSLLDHSPTTRVSIAVAQVSQGRWHSWLALTLGLVLGTAGALVLGARATAWALRRPSDNARVSFARRQHRRPLPGSDLSALLRTDRASVWRSAPLRRGLLVLGVLPGAVAASVRVEWSSLALLPGLVAAGAGLLFGVNAFCLDAQGGVWLSSLPHAARDSAVAKALVTGETCLLTSLLAVTVGALRAHGSPAAADLTALLSSAVALSCLVVATCLRLSVERPHRADLRGPRDAPAPPATMAVYSLRLALSTTLVGTLFVGAAESGSVLAGPAIGVLVVLWALRSLERTFRAFGVPAVRARVISVVASG